MGVYSVADIISTILSSLLMPLFSTILPLLGVNSNFLSSVTTTLTGLTGG
jgi:hypothetical protein